MKQVAKLLLIDKDNNYLLMHRSGHPALGDDPDLPGGTLEDGESPVEAMIREVYEEAGVAVDKNAVRELYAGDDYSAHQTHYSLFMTQVPKRPHVTTSWEHSSYEWLNRNDFLEKVKDANDTYMHMVYDVLK
jgi:8-oxo-dGTP diphosphatase